MKPLATAANAAWWTASLPGYFAFVASLDEPQRAQEALLHRYLQRNAQTAFGREHHLGKVDSLQSFRQHVPPRTYDQFTPWIDRIAAGETQVLTADPVTRFVPSSGSTRAAKWIPYTAGLQSEFNRAIGPWIVDLYMQQPKLIGGPAYWSITPATASDLSRSSVVPIGFDEDAAYLGGARQHLVNAVMAVPAAIKNVQDIDLFRYCTARMLLAEADLRLVSAWHPSFVAMLLDEIETEWDSLLQDIHSGNVCSRLHTSKSLKALDSIQRTLRPDPCRADALHSAGRGNWRGIWPAMCLVSCWTDARAAAPAQSLQSRLPQVRFQPKGLLATEAFVTVPFRDQFPLAIRSHFFEFEADDGRLSTAHELQAGAEYAVLVTTAGGLWRYRLGDLVRCTGFLLRTPTLRFVGRHDKVVDIAGEKLSDGFVGRILETLLKQHNIASSFAMLAPDAHPVTGIAHYTLFLDTRQRLPAAIGGDLDEKLHANPHYAYCRRLGQLNQIRVFQIDGAAFRVFAEHYRVLGMKLGDIKPVALDNSPHWSTLFQGRYVDRLN